MSTQTPSTVVVGYDGSAQADLALAWAVQDVAATGQTLTILHSVPLEPVSGFPVGGPVGWEGDYHWGSIPGQAVTGGAADDPALTGPRHAGIEHARATLGSDRVLLASAVGNAAARLVEASGDADLVVLGSRGRGGAAAALLGSTAYAVTAHAHCPVVVVRTPAGVDRPVHPGPDRPVVVGVDDLTTSGPALDAAARVAADHGAPLRIVRALAVPAFVPWLDDTIAYDDALRSEATDIGREAVLHLQEVHPGLECTAEVVAGQPSRVLARESTSAGMVVVASRGRGGFRGLLLGSVSHGLLHEAHCPVMVVR